MAVSVARPLSVSVYALLSRSCATKPRMAMDCIARAVMPTAPQSVAVATQNRITRSCALSVGVNFSMTYRMHQITRDHSGSLVPRSPSKRIRHCVQCSAFAHVGRFAAHQEVLARRCEEIDHLSVFAKPCLVLRTSRNDHDVAPDRKLAVRCRDETPSCP